LASRAHISTYNQSNTKEFKSSFHGTLGYPLETLKGTLKSRWGGPSELENSQNMSQIIHYFFIHL